MPLTLTQPIVQPTIASYAIRRATLELDTGMVTANVQAMDADGANVGPEQFVQLYTEGSNPEELSAVESMLYQELQRVFGVSGTVTKESTITKESP